MRDALRADLVRDEGIRLKPYRDTVLKTTIGVGRNLDDVGITEEEAHVMLDNDMDRVLAELNRRYGWFASMTENRRRAIANMAFNLGAYRLSGFTKMLDAIKEQRWADAASEALESKWAQQVGERAKRIAALIKEG